MTKKPWKVRDKRDHPRLDRHWECFQVSREKVAADYLKKKTKQKKTIWIFCRYQEEPFDFTCITLPLKGHNLETRERFFNLWFLPQDEYIYIQYTHIYIYEWVGFYIYTGCCQKGSFLLTNPEYWNMGYITGGQVYA